MSTAIITLPPPGDEIGTNAGNDCEPIPEISVTTVTMHTHLPSHVNLFSISHYLDHHQEKWPEILLVKKNFGRQIAPSTKKRIFYFATWFRVESTVERPHNLCIRFNGNGAIHIVGVINPALECPWLEDWLRKFLADVHQTPVPCADTIKARPNIHNLLACADGYIWSPKWKVPIGYSPLVNETDVCGDQLVLSGKPVVPMDSTSSSGIEADTPKHHHGQKPSFRTMKGNPIRYFDADGHMIASEQIQVFQTFARKLQTQKRKRDATPSQTKQVEPEVYYDDSDRSSHKEANATTPLSFGTRIGSINPGMDTPFDIEDVEFHWVTSCINAKCETCTMPNQKRPKKNLDWLDRDKFKSFVRHHYPSLMVSFDPDAHKALQIKFFYPEPESNGRLEERGSVFVTRTGLFWLYGFKEMEFANEAALMMQSLIEVFRTQEFPVTIEAAPEQHLINLPAPCP